jgi:hypothetical protein
MEHEQPPAHGPMNASVRRRWEFSVRNKESEGPGGFARLNAGQIRYSASVHRPQCMDQQRASGMNDAAHRRL